jgi:hypothetical protein
MKIFSVVLFCWAVLAGAQGDEVKPYLERLAASYSIDRVLLPPTLNPQIGGLVTLRDGRLAATFHHGEVALLSPATGEWKIFAEGLHEPLGIFEDDDGSLLVMQRAELTRLRDTDHDGRADVFQTVWDDFGMTGNYHEFAFGPVRGPDGKLYVSLNLASEGASIRKEIRGRWSELGPPREKFYSEDWRSFAKKEIGGMYSRVAWRGWVMQIDPVTGAGQPFASGFRSPDGLGFDEHGNFVVVDNQGDWRGTNEVHVVTRGGFYGHPASLAWRDDWDNSDPMKASVERLDRLRTPPAICIPYETYAASPTQPVVIPKSAAWGPFGGQLLVGDMNYPRLFRLLLEKIGDRWQGACVMLAESEELKGGLHRLAFISDTLYIGRIHLAWAGGEGIGVLKRAGQMPFEIADMRITPTGFHFVFTKPLAPGANDARQWRGESYYYAYHAAYGSPKMDKAELAATAVTVSADGLTADVTLPPVKSGYVCDFDLAQVRSGSGEPILNPRIAYTVNRYPSSKPPSAPAP